MSHTLYVRVRPGNVADQRVAEGLIYLLVPSPEGELEQLGRLCDVDVKPMFQAFRDLMRARWVPIERLRACVAALASRLASEPDILQKVQPYFLSVDRKFLLKALPDLLGVLERAKADGAKEVTFWGVH